MNECLFSEAAQNSGRQRIYSVEFLRIYLILSVFLFHVGQMDTELKDGILTPLHTNYWMLQFAVEAFFVIGGFFLYRRIARGDDASSRAQASSPATGSMLAHMGKLWMRLVPGVIFCYVLLVAVGVQRWYNFPLCILSASQGIGINQGLIGWGDWYVEVYFILSIFFISLFHISRKSAWFWICTLAILCWCVHMNNRPWEGMALGGMYYGVLAHGIVRGLSCMALGMVASYLSNVWNIKERLPLRIIATVYEAVALFMLFNYMYRTSRAPYNPIAMEFVVAMLLISAAHGWGYLSKFLNRISGFMWFSRYTYSLLLSQATLCAYFTFHHKFDLPHPTFPLVIFGAAIPLTLVEYHLIERWLVPKLRACFQNAPDTSPGE